MSDKIRTTTQDFTKLNDFEKFILDCGYLYDTEEELKAGYDRSWKASHGILVTAEEFDAEIKSRVKWDKTLDTAKLYETLVRLVQEKKLTPGDVMQYAVYTWCLRKPEAVVAYEEAPGKWLVNNCGTEISEERARVEVCEEWGFEASRVRIIVEPKAVEGNPFGRTGRGNGSVRRDCACAHGGKTGLAAYVFQRPDLRLRRPVF